uniref:Pentatricopeptide repeat-containing protein At3g05340 family n=1 Tax=Cajanus cajan TaxID=3821 RepID=A0A151T303_CAJCA|nr:Pentatricopeptide repeat-containing protein At3g05340 family [Cajanus cajan]
MPVKDIVSWNTMISGFLRRRDFDAGFRFFKQMADNILMRVAWAVTVVTWTTVISGLAQNEFYEDGLRLFHQMRCGSVSPNSLTYLSALMACSGLQALLEGSKIHGLLWKLGMQSDLCIESALMDLYSKCGSLEAENKF